MKFLDFLELVDAIAEDIVKERLPVRHMALVLKKVKGISEEELRSMPVKEALKLLEEAIEELKKDTDFLEALSKTLQLTGSIFTTSQTPLQREDTTLRR